MTIKFGPRTHVSACESNSLDAEVNGLGWLLQWFWCVNVVEEILWLYEVSADRDDIEISWCQLQLGPVLQRFASLRPPKALPALKLSVAWSSIFWVTAEMIEDLRSSKNSLF